MGRQWVSISGCRLGEANWQEGPKREREHEGGNTICLRILAEVVNDMKEEKKKSHDQRIEERQEYIRLTKERLVFEQSREEREKEADLSKKRLEMEQSREDREIMSMNTSNMSPMKKIIFSFTSNGNH
jgi:lysyl-tRNA synthetase class I